MTKVPCTNIVPELTIRMLGEFSMTYGGHTISETSTRQKKPWWLVEYLIYHRGRDVSSEALIDLFWGEDTSGNPHNSLKNLVYRARRLLRELDASIEFIRFQRNTYAWNAELPCRVDVFELMRFIEQGKDAALSEEERMEALKQAIELYQGEFLPKSSSLDWVVVKSAYFHSMYAQCVLKLAAFLQSRGKLDSVIRLSEHALTYLPYEESVHQNLLRAYAQTGRQKMAVEHYEHIARQFDKELGVRLRPDIVRTYREIVQGMQSPELDLGMIQEDLHETCVEEGAFFCEYDVFRQIYHLQARAMQRAADPLFLGLISVTGSGGGEPEPHRARKIVGPLIHSVCQGLRRGDVVARYSATQLVLLLPLASCGDGRKVLRRLLRHFESTCPLDGIKLQTRLQAVEVLERPPNKPQRLERGRRGL